MQVLLDRLSRGENRISVCGLRGSLKSLIFSVLGASTRRPVIYITPTVEASRDAFRDFAFFLGESGVFLYPPWDLVPLDALSSQREIRSKRVEILLRLSAGDASVVVVPVEALLQKVIPACVLTNYVETVSLGDVLDRQQLVKKMIEGGYKRVSLVEEEGEFSVRGYIVDIYPSTAARPLRIEFIGDEVESIREFDPVTQRSKQEILDFVLTPMSELIVSDEARKRASKNVRNRANDLGLSGAKKDNLVATVENGLFSSVHPHLLSLFYGNVSDGDDGLDTVFAFVPDDSIVIVDDMSAVVAAAERAGNAVDRLIEKSQQEGRFYLEKDAFSVPFDAVAKTIDTRQQIVVDELAGSSHHSETTELVTFSVEVDLGVADHRDRLRPGDNGLLGPLTARFKSWIDEGNLVVFLCSEEGMERMMHLLEGYSLSPARTGATFLVELERDFGRGKLVLMPGTITEGFHYPALRLVVASEEEIFGRKVRRKRKIRAKEGFFLKSFSELNEGNFVVHADHGIGIYRGLEKLAVRDVENDFLLIEYHGGDRLYIPVDRLDQIQRYIGPDGHVPVVDKLGSTSWDTVKARVKKSVRAIAKELIALYATREYMEGHQFSSLDRYYEEFVSSFEFEETPDQAGAIADVNDDMNSSKPMDRLVCGDAGFGKTEVAIRASFRAAMDGKQIAVLVPTTILAEQHYQTFSARFEKYPVRVEVLNRYKSKAEQKRIVDDINKGIVDVIIGTQRILQKDVSFKELGLVIIDEEQRFGVKDKEKLKKLRTLVDVLTLSATPIPRTLHLSLVGIRDLSVIETPPEDRQSVRVYVSELDEDLVRDAIRQELARDGQIFFVHDRVRSIERMGRFLEELVPEVRIGIAHGQMKARDLEDVMVKFLRKEYNVLLCTTIIGSGVDIPSVNTIFIDRADTFGLSQLYQLRGRVGRSREDGYCYLLVRTGTALSREARKRLQVIQDYSEPGAGFKVATHDLEIRGGGNLLGVSQSGHISSVGYELYVELMEKTIRELKGEKVEEKEIKPEINFGLSAFIPDTYIADEHRRLMTYKRISLTAAEEELASLKDELIDCYGVIPSEVQNLIEVISIRNTLKEIMVQKMEYDGSCLRVAFHRESPIDPQKILLVINRRKDEGITFSPDYRLTVPMPGLGRGDIIAAAKDLIDSIMH